MILDKFRGHFSTVIRHKNQVFIHCVKAGIVWRGMMHDISKFSPSEFIPGVIYFQGTRSPNEAERENNGYSKAWMHHKGRNKHHFEYWTDYNPETKTLDPVKMPEVCDVPLRRRSACGRAVSAGNGRRRAALRHQRSLGAEMSAPGGRRSESELGYIKEREA